MQRELTTSVDASAAPHDRIRQAAFTLFAAHGYDETSVDDIARAAGVSRSTFFRYFGSKESVIFPDHDMLLEQVENRLRVTSESSALRAVSDAVRVVLFHYVTEGERARARYGLTSSVPALRERELVSGARYQRLFRRHIASWADEGVDTELRAEMMSAAVVAAHNRVLRRWLRGECTDPHVEIDHAMAAVAEAFTGARDSGPVVVVRSDLPASVVAEALEAAAADLRQ